MIYLTLKWIFEVKFKSYKFQLLVKFKELLYSKYIQNIFKIRFYMILDLNLVPFLK